MCQQQKRYNTAIDRLSDFKLGMAKHGKGLEWLGRPQVAKLAMHSQLPLFLVKYYSPNSVESSLFYMPNAISSIGQIIKSMCVCVCLSVCHTKRI